MALGLAPQAKEPYYLDEENEYYPAEFRGKWAPSQTACKQEVGEDVITIGRTKIWAYEADSKLLKLTPQISFTAPNGSDAETIIALVAERGETEVSIGKIRLTLSGNKLYTSRVDAVTEDQQWKYGNVKCL
jgi:hypothetical protein